MADNLKDILKEGAEARLYVNVNLALLAGLMLIFGISVATNMIVFKRKYYVKGLLYGNLLALGFTMLILLFISWISIAIVYQTSYSQLSIIDELRLVPYFYIYFAIYILQNPVMFWYIAFIIYHISLIFLIKYLSRAKPQKRNKKKGKEPPLFSSALLGSKTKKR